MNGLNHYKLWSPNREFFAEYVGTEIGMGGPTIGGIILKRKDEQRVFSSPAAWAPSCFSDNSLYFIYFKVSSLGQQRYCTVVEIPTGRELWTEEKSDGELVLLKNREIDDLNINGHHCESLEDIRTYFDISRCLLETKE